MREQKSDSWKCEHGDDSTSCPKCKIKLEREKLAIDASLQSARISTKPTERTVSAGPSMEISPLILQIKIGKMDRQIVADFMSQLISESRLATPALSALQEALKRSGSQPPKPASLGFNEERLSKLPPAARDLIKRRESMMPVRKQNNADELTVFLNAVNSLPDDVRAGLTSVIDNLVKRSESRGDKRKVG